MADGNIVRRIIHWKLAMTDAISGMVSGNFFQAMHHVDSRNSLVKLDRGARGEQKHLRYVDWHTNFIFIHIISNVKLSLL